MATQDFKGTVNGTVISASVAGVLSMAPGKTLTVTQDTSLDEAVSMSSKATVTTGNFAATMVCGTSGTITLATNTLRWTKIGPLVHLSGYLVVQSVSSPVGSLSIGNLTVGGAASAEYWATGSIFLSGIVDSTTDPFYQIYMGGGHTLAITKIIDGVAADCAADLKASSAVIIGITYIAE